MEYRVFEEWIGHVIISYHSDQWQERTDCTSSTLTDFGIQFVFFCRELVIKELLLSQGTWTQFVPNSWFGLPLKDVVAVCNNTCCRSWMEFIEESFYVCTFRDVVEIYRRHHRQPLPWRGVSYGGEINCKKVRVRLRVSSRGGHICFSRVKW